ncbi:hypothetical protein [Tropicimonas sediminicola]|uniref:Uncharacterized protein n=1 Tax=Tropicimonas sediminicola TaxID=1031541 RepID=A0A239GXX3_9RHOB|nr:hypothetical protein [Tropicimonas sediminicola]SNS72894.1 hypothetical protein SAMN05421757_103116 [Tropicimonas sediminicola]
MKCVVHIGTEKTGTTSLQHFFAANTETLLERGLAYSAAFGRPSNRKLATISMDPRHGDSSFVEYGLATPEDHAAFRDAVIAEFEAEIAMLKARGDIHTFFVSNEHLHSRLVKPEMVGRVADLLRRHFAEIEVVCFLRPQADLALSCLSTSARVGMKVTSKAFTTDGPYYDYLGLRERWLEHFGTIRMVPYKRHRDTVGWFLEHFGLEREGLTEPAGLNTALDYRSIHLLSLIGPRVVGSQMNVNRNIFLKEHPVEEALSVDREMARRCQERNRAANEALCALTDDVTMDDLTPDFDRYPERGNIHELDVDVAAASRVNWLVARFNAELALERAQTRMAAAELAAAQGDRDKAAALLENAEKLIARAADTGLEVPVKRAGWMGRKVQKLARRLSRAAPKP